MRLNMKASTINDYERGKAIPKSSEIQRIQRILGKLPKIPKKKSKIKINK